MPMQVHGMRSIIKIVDDKVYMDRVGATLQMREELILIPIMAAL